MTDTHIMRCGRIFLLATGAFLLGRLWSAFCLFPLFDWNAIRLAPSFMLRFGPTPYPGIEQGPVTTWIYGPVPLVLQLPATFTQSAIAAMMVACTITLLLVVSPLLIVLLSDRKALPTARVDAVWAFFICLALWPNSSLHYIQSDNTAIASGLLANWFLLRPHSGKIFPTAAAAVFVSLAVWSKQTFLGLVVAQLIWIYATSGKRAAIRHALACAAAGLALGALFINWFGFEGIWINLVELPSRLPFWPDPVERALGLAPHLTGYVAIPLLILVLAGSRPWKRSSLWLLPVLSWICLLPTGLVSILKIGGTANSLTGFLFLLPTSALAVVTALRTKSPQLASSLLATGILATVILQLTQAPLRPWMPLTQHLDRAAFLARQLPGEIYFPWNPLATFFNERRFYHVEDGLYVRQVTGLPPSQANTLNHLPPRWSVTAFRGTDTGWGIVEQLHPPDVQTAAFGEWTLYSWPPRQ